jgi:hypothetical protein
VSKIQLKTNKKNKTRFKRKEQRETEVLPGMAHRTVRCATGQCPVHHRTVSGAPGRIAFKLFIFGFLRRSPLKFTGLSGAPPDSVRCSNGTRPQELGSLGISRRLLRYNSPDMSGVHRTVRCNLGATATSRQRSTLTVNSTRGRSQSRGSERHRTVRCASDCPVPHEDKSLQRSTSSNPNG